MRSLQLLALCGASACFLAYETSWRADAAAASTVPIDSACARRTLHTVWGRDSIGTGTAFDAVGAIKGVDFQSGTIVLFRWVPDSAGKWLLNANAGYGGHGPKPDSVAHLTETLRSTVLAVLTACGDSTTPVTTHYHTD